MSAKAAAGVSVSDCDTAAKDSSEYSSSGERVPSASFRSSLCGMRQVGKKESLKDPVWLPKLHHVCVYNECLIYVVVFMEENIT